MVNVVAKEAEGIRKKEEIRILAAQGAQYLRIEKEL